MCYWALAKSGRRAKKVKRDTRADGTFWAAAQRGRRADGVKEETKKTSTREKLNLIGQAEEMGK